MKFFLAALLFLSPSSANAARAIMEGIAATQNNLFIDTVTYRLGIGMSSPTRRVYISSSSNGTTGVFIENTNTGTAAASDVTLFTGASQALVVSAQGSGYTTSGAFINLGGTIQTDVSLTGGLTVGTKANAPFSLWTNNTERVRISGAGNLGIGTTNPQSAYLLTLVDPTNAFIYIGTGTATGQQNAGISWAVANTNDFNISAMAGKALSLGANGFTAKFIIAASGNVGVGTINPGEKFEVNGKQQFSGTAPTAGTCVEGSLSAVAGTDNSGSANGVAGGANTCTINFASTWGHTPYCICNAQVSGSGFCQVQSIGTTSMVLSSQVTANSQRWSWICF